MRRMWEVDTGMLGWARADPMGSAGRLAGRYVVSADSISRASSEPVLLLSPEGLHPYATSPDLPPS